MKQPKASRRQIVLELTEEQSRQIERTTGKFVTELQIEIVEVTATAREPLTPNHNHSIEEGETQ